MNPAKSYAHLFSPLGGDAGDNYRAPGLITFLRSAHVPLNAEALKACGAKYAFVGVPFDEGNLMEAAPETFHITPHYKDYPSVLARIGTIDPGSLRNFLERRWRKVTPKKLARQHESELPPA